MSSPSPFMELVGRVAFETARLRPFVPTYLHLLASALFPIYVGAHASLSIPSSAARPKKKKQSELADEEPEIIAEKVEGLTPKDAILFPLLAGFTLSSLYFIIKWLEDPSTLNKILSYYFMQVGFLFGTKFLRDSFAVIRSVCLPNQYAQEGLLWRVDPSKQRYDAVGIESDAQAYHVSPLPGLLRRLHLPKVIADQIWRTRTLLYAKCSLNFHVHRLVTLKIPVGLLDALAISATSALVGFFTFFYKPWYLSNLLGFAFCYGSTQYMSPTTFWTGTLLLSALFCYDIYFVFFTPMMVTVATKLDIPIKLLFPRPPSPAEIEKGLAGLAMLGLGDIVIPGMMVALALRFDLYLHYLRKSKSVDGKMEKAIYIPATGGWGERFWVGRSAASPLLQAKAFPKTYFKAGLIGYALGMIATLLAMQVTEHAQPALLYLVPGVLTALWGTAAFKGDLNEMWNYTEDTEAEGAKSLEKVMENKSTEKMEAENAEGKVLQLDEKARRVAKTDGPRGGDTKNKSTDDDKQLEVTSVTTEEESDGNIESEDDALTPSESLSDPGSSSESSPRLDHRKPVKGKTGGAFLNQEQKCRHLLWFSIDFPSPPPLTEQEDIGESETTTQHSKAGSSDIAKAGGRHEENTKNSTDGNLNTSDGEPPGKRRRVR